MKKFISSFIVTIIGSWIISKILLYISVFLLKSFCINIYLIFSILFVLPILSVFGLSTYSFVHKEKEIAIGVFLAGIVFCLLFGYMGLWTIGEMGL